MNSLKVLKQLHLYLGLSIGFIVSFSGITGSIYVWQPELTKLVASQLFTVKKFNTISYADILNTVHKIEEQQKDSIVKITFPYREQQSISVSYTNKNTFYYHPKTGLYLGENSKVASFFSTLLKLHRNLGINGWGKYIMGGSALIFAFFILSSGLLIWYQIYKKKLKKGFQIDWFSKKKKFNFNLHKVVGIYFAIPLSIMAVSGGYFTFNKEYKQLLNTIPYLNKTTVSTIILPKIGDAFLVDKITNQFYPIYKAWAIYYPTPKTPNYKFRFINSSIINNGGLRKTTDITTDKNFKITKVTSYHSALLSNKMTAQMYPIHIGESFGFFNRIFISACGLLPLILFVTGIRFYFYRKRVIK